MIVKNGICYPDDMAPVLSVVGCAVLDDTHVRIRFDTGDVRVVDISPLAALPALAPLANPSVLRNFAIDHGVLTWLDGELDIAPEWLLDHGVPESYPAITVPPLSVAEGPASYDAKSDSAG